MNSLLDTYLEERNKPKDFSPWVLEPETCCLVFRNIYDIPLGEIHDSATMLDWIFQIQNKTWATPEIMFQLLAALNYYLSPQACYCSWEKNLYVENPRERVRGRAKK